MTRVWLALLVFCGGFVNCEEWVYAGERLEGYQWAAVIDTAAEEILRVASYPLDCGVVTTHVSSVADGVSAHPFDLPGRIDPDGAHGNALAREVRTVAQARYECMGYWPCNAVQVFTLPETDILLAVYYTSNAVETSHPLSSSGGDEQVDPNRWLATVAIDRVQGYACPASARDVDPIAFYRMWAGRFSGRLYDVTDALGVPASSVLTDAQIAPYSTAITQYFNTVGHVYRMWPNYNCSLTPVLYSAESGCLAARCPANTVCPSGYRLRNEAWNSCHGGWSGDSGEEVVLTATPSTDTGDETLTWTEEDAPGLDESDRTLSWYSALRYQSPGSNLPCGFDTGKGVCSHPWPTSSSPAESSDPKCVCTGAAIPVGGDVGCQFDGGDSLVFGSDGSDCVSDPPVSLLCSQRGTCTFDRSAVSWGATEVFGSGDVVSCDCDAPFLPPKCTSTICDAGGDIGDCHVLGRGACVQTDGVWGCACGYPFFGAHCEHEDVATAATNASTVCYIQESGVESPPPDASVGEWLLCSGFGECSSTANGTGCVCPPTRSGPRCEYVACDHAEDCGYLGACVHTYDMLGRAETVCQCAQYASDGLAGIPLAALSDGRCTVDLCDQGTFVAVTTPTDGVFNTVPTGVCECLRAITPPDPSLVTVTMTPVVDVNGSETTQAVPSHPWLPTLWEADEASPTGSSPFIPSVRISNTGVRCDTPSCPTYVHPVSSVPLAPSCMVEPLVLDAVCLPCSTFPEMGLCRQTTGFGGVCDCPGDTALAYDIDVARADGTDPEVVGGMEPYYFVGTNTRYATPGHPNDAMCTPYCRNGGTWDATVRQCNCAGTAWTGDTCSDPRCPNGVWTPDAVGSCTFCNTGWWPPESCDQCAPGATGLSCELCEEGWYRPAVGAGCVECDARLECNTASGATEMVDCRDASASNPPRCVCGPKYTGPECRDCAAGYAQFPFLPGVCFACSSILGCDASGTIAVECTTEAQRCICSDPLLDSQTYKCGRCADGYLKVGGECVECASALGCFPPGTVDATCRQRSPGSATCNCDTAAGYGGPVCDTCQESEGWFWYDNACVKCDHDCGTWGMATCPDRIPGCVCTHGRSGDDCESCTGCGPGGTCSSDPESSTWCVCSPGYVRNPANVALFGPETLPCDTCDPTSHVLDAESGTCVSIVDMCGDPGVVGVDVALTLATGSCRCRDGWVDPPTEASTPMCRLCSEGHVGPSCLACVPGCQPPHGVCRWDPTQGVPTCDCAPGFSGVACSDCADGHVSDGAGNCVACPSCGLFGTCRWDGDTSRTVCDCDAVHMHSVTGNARSPCTVCLTGRSPLTCSLCPTCPLNSVCVEPVHGHVECTCRPGARHVAGFTDASIHPCFGESLADTLEDLEDVAEVVRVSMLASAAYAEEVAANVTAANRIRAGAPRELPPVPSVDTVTVVPLPDMDIQTLAFGAALTVGVLFILGTSLVAALQCLCVWFQHRREGHATGGIGSTKASGGETDAEKDDEDGPDQDDVTSSSSGIRMGSSAVGYRFSGPRQRRAVYDSDDEAPGSQDRHPLLSKSFHASRRHRHQQGRKAFRGGV